MGKRLLKLDEFIAGYPFWGKWEVSYTDGTHLEESEFVKLGDIIIDEFEKTAQEYPILPFTFEPVPDQEIKSRFSELFERKNKADQAQGKNKADQAKRLIWDQLADSMLRTGLLCPQFCLMEEQKLN